MSRKLPTDGEGFEAALPPEPPPAAAHTNGGKPADFPDDEMDERWEPPMSEVPPRPQGDPRPQPQGGGGQGNRKPASRFRGIVTETAFMRLMKPPNYLIDDILQSGMVYGLCGHTGSGKTLAALYMSACIATGQMFAGKQTQQGNVLFLAGENPDNVRHQWYGMRDHMGLTEPLPIYFHDGSFDIEADIERLRASAERVGAVSLVTTDTLQSFFQGDDDNDNLQMLAAARAFRELTGLRGYPTIMIPCHPAKSAGRGDLQPRGGSSFTNEIDALITTWARDDETVEMKPHPRKFRGVPFDPIDFKLVRTKPAGLLDARGRQMKATVISPLLRAEVEKKARERETREDQALAAFKANPRLTLAALGEKLGVSQATASRLRKRLEDVKWIKQKGRTFVLTEDGEGVLNG